LSQILNLLFALTTGLKNFFAADRIGKFKVPRCAAVNVACCLWI